MSAAKHTDALRGALAVAGAAFLWGLWKVWLRGPALDPAAQGGCAIAMAGVLGTIIALRGRRSWPGVPPRAWMWLVALGVAEAANCGLYFRAISEGDVATGVATHYLAPVLVAIVSPFLHEPMGKRAPWATGVAFAATAVLVGMGGTGAGTRAAAIEGASSAVFYMSVVFIAKRLSPYFTTWELVGFHDLLAGPLILLGSHTPLSLAGRTELLLLLAGGLISGTIAAGLYYYGLSLIPPARAAVLGYIEPVAATLIGTLILHEPMTGLKAGAIGVVLAAGISVATEDVPITRTR